MKKIGISTDCMCDLPASYLAENGIDILQFYIHTATGRFWNESEITSNNILEYLGAGNVLLRSNVPEPEECRAYFEELLTRYDEVIHITTSDKVGLSHPNAQAALELMEEESDRISLINSGAVSTGLGHMVMLAVSMRDNGKSVAEIIEACDALRSKISCSFIVPNADYLHRMGYTIRGVRIFCNIFKIHPIISIKNGKLSAKAFQMGNYEKAVMRYIRGELRHGRRIDRKQLFITHVGCPATIIERIKAEVDSMRRFDNITVTKASAVISSWCGPETVGILFVCR